MRAVEEQGSRGVVEKGLGFGGLRLGKKNEDHAKCKIQNVACK
jgi:hypothetical protein